MKKTLISILMALASGIAFSQQALLVSPGIAKSSPAEDSIRTAALDYADGYYSGDAERMKKAIHFDINKAFPRFISKTGQVALSYSTYSMLVGLSAAKTGYKPDTARHIGTEILQVTPEIAVVKVRSVEFNDYLELAMIGHEWKIINVLWNSPKNAAWLKDFSLGNEKKGIESAVNGYIQGTQNADVEKLNEFLTADFNRVNLVPIGKDGALAVQRVRFDGLEKNAWAGAGKLDETQKDNSSEILDAMDGLAMVKLTTGRNNEYLQLYKDSGGWRVFNSLLIPRKDIGLSQMLAATSGELMPGFSLPVHGGGKYTLSDHKGKNILLMFPRGWVGNSWCAFCPYQYLDLADLEKKEQIMKKYNIEIVFVMPYNDERITDWMAKFPETMKTLEGIKNPAAGTSSLQKEFADWTKAHYPHNFDLSGGFPNTFPVLCDEQRTLSKQLKLFTAFWDGAISEQNVAAIYLIDKNGILRWKYISQMTEDRPSSEHLMQVIRETLK
ncbi:MAG: nuclear transport factor 2 family protein [Bacteroidetes bacterium]|nr:nuclear transport factor 2 family protein [Bacteroidota bacterium]